MSLEHPQELPIGSGKRKIEDYEQVPAIEVANEVAWVNPNIQTPFKFEMGESTKLGLLVQDTEGGSARHVQGVPGHGRSAILAQVLFKDTAGRIYRDVDLKGIGHIMAMPEGMQAGLPSNRSDGSISGIFEYDIALKDASMAEEFLSNGIRTYRYIAIVKLKQLINPKSTLDPMVRPYLFSIDKALEDGLLPQGSQPAVAIRAYGTRTRIGDIDNESIEKGKRELQDAVALTRQELGENEITFDSQQYLEWFAKTLGENIGRMHASGYTHGFLTRHNITLDCRIVDLDSVAPSENNAESLRDIMLLVASKMEEKNYEETGALIPLHSFPTSKDILDGWDTFRALTRSTMRIINWADNGEIFNLYRDGYLKGLGEIEKSKKPQ